MGVNVKELILNKEYAALQQALAASPELANKEIPYGEKNPGVAHPLHRLCDAVFAGLLLEEEGLRMARILLEHGARVNGNTLKEKQDTPLIAASSLNADRLAYLYIEKGAEIHHPGTHGGTALHWAAWCGRDALTRRLVQEGAGLHKRCMDFKATPLFWAVHGLKAGPLKNRPGHLECIRSLIAAGAEINTANASGETILDLIGEESMEVKALFS